MWYSSVASSGVSVPATHWLDSEQVQITGMAAQLLPLNHYCKQAEWRETTFFGLYGTAWKQIILDFKKALDVRYCHVSRQYLLWTAGLYNGNIWHIGSVYERHDHNVMLSLIGLSPYPDWSLGSYNGIHEAVHSIKKVRLQHDNQPP